MMLLVMPALFMMTIVERRPVRGLLSAFLERFIEFFPNVPGAVVPGTITSDILTGPQRSVEDRANDPLILIFPMARQLDRDAYYQNC